MTPATAIGTSTQADHVKFEVAAKWKGALDDGFLAVPNILIKKQAALKISPSELVTLLNLMVFWWRADELPFPGTTVIAKRMGVTSRTVERNLSELAERGLIKKITVQGRRFYDLTGLVTRLEQEAEGGKLIRQRKKQQKEDEASSRTT